MLDGSGGSNTIVFNDEKDPTPGTYRFVTNHGHSQWQSRDHLSELCQGDDQTAAAEKSLNPWSSSQAACQPSDRREAARAEATVVCHRDLEEASARASRSKAAGLLWRGGVNHAPRP